MEGSVTISQRELLAIAPDIRKFVKDATTTRRIPTGSSTDVPIRRAYIEEVPDESETLATYTLPVVHHGRQPLRNCNDCNESYPYPVAPKSVTLRAVSPVFNNSLQVESLLDPGSEVICMRRGIWEQLGVALSSSDTVRLESADTHSSQSLGTIDNLLMTIGGIDMFVQVVVMENASYDVLLGLPFFTHLQVDTRFFNTGEQHITITDPASDRKVTLPTQARERRRREAPKGF